MNGIFHHFHHALHRHSLHVISRGHRGFSGFGGQHGMRGGDPWRPALDGLQRGRKLGAADLQLLLLALLAERPSHGYELIKALDERSSGYYSPSPGMVYPALTYLEEVGHASFETQGTKKLYSVTAAGRAHLEEHRVLVDGLLQQLAWIGSRMERLRRAMAGTGADGGAVDDAPTAEDAAGADSPDGFFPRHGRERFACRAPELHAARRSLKAALLDKSGAAREEQRRIASILEHAAAAIRRGGDGGDGSADPAGPAGPAGNACHQTEG